MKTKIIEFTGIPNSGKTTLINRLKEELSIKYGISVQTQKVNTEIVPSEIPKKTWDRNVWTTFEQLQSIVQAYHSSADIVLLDRGFFDAYFWANFMLKQNKATYEQSYGIQCILMQMYENLGFYPDCLFLIDVCIEEALRRSFLMKGGSVYSNSDFLNQYQIMFFDIFKEYLFGKKENQIIPIPSFYYDTTRMGIDEICEIVANDIRKICEE